MHPGRSARSGSADFSSERVKSGREGSFPPVFCQRGKFWGICPAFVTAMRVPLLFVLLSLTTAVEARIGETPIQFADRYGRPKDTNLTAILDKNSPLLEGAVHHTYEYQGWKIRAAFLQLDGPCIRMDFQKTSAAVSGIVVREDELRAIMTANLPTGMIWTSIMYDNPHPPNKGIAKAFESMIAGAAGQKMWQRTDGALISLRSNLIVRLELPAARQLEDQLKRDKEEKARASSSEILAGCAPSASKASWAPGATRRN